MQFLNAKSSVILFSSVFLIYSTQFSLARPVRSDGGVCSSTGSTRSEGTTSAGKREFCTWDTCSFKRCDKEGHCHTVTELSNPTECVVGKRPLKGKIPKVDIGKDLKAQ